jgi:hypothetical protein
MYLFAKFVRYFTVTYLGADPKSVDQHDDHTSKCKSECTHFLVGKQTQLKVTKFF